MAFANLGKDRVRSLPLSQIMVNPAQPRTRFEDEALQQLAQSIAANGLLQPVTVREAGPGKYRLVAGERRCRACMLLGYTHVPAIVKNCTMQESAVLALIENLQRQDLDFVEEAQGIAALMRTQNLSQEQAARLLGKSQSAVANKLRLLRHGETVLSALREAGLTERHARALLKLPGEAEKLEAIATIQRLELSVAATEKYVASLLSAAPSRPRKTDVSSFLNTLTDSLAKIQRSGVKAISERRETDAQIVLTITIPKG